MILSSCLSHDLSVFQFRILFSGFFPPKKNIVLEFIKLFRDLGKIKRYRVNTLTAFYTFSTFVFRIIKLKSVVKIIRFCLGILRSKGI